MSWEMILEQYYASFSIIRNGGGASVTAVASQAVETMDRARGLVETMPSKSVQYFVQFEDDHLHMIRMAWARETFCILRCALLAGAGKERVKGLQ